MGPDRCKFTAEPLAATKGHALRLPNVAFMDDAQRTRLARNEDFFREVNENMIEGVKSGTPDLLPYEFDCECSDARCTERVKLTLLEFAHIRTEPTWFVVKPNHVVDEIEEVIETGPDHMVVEKYGEAGKVAIRLEARRTSE